MDNALLKHLARNDSEGVQLLDFIVDCDTDGNETCEILKTYQRFHCLAIYYTSKNKWEDAFCMWDRLMKKDIEDAHFPGYAYVAEQLAKYDCLIFNSCVFSRFKILIIFYPYIFLDLKTSL